jgi:hypothetical protein
MLLSSRTTVSCSRKRLFAAGWFAAFASATAAALFLRPPFAMRVVVLFVILPGVSSFVAALAYGGPILNPAKSWRDSILRSLLVTAVGYLLFAVSFACTLPLFEPGWAWRGIAGLFLLTVAFGSLMVGPVVILVGVLAGVTLHRFAHLFRTPQTKP